MGSNAGLDLGVIVVGTIAFSVALLSLYISRVYLPWKMKEAYSKSITALAAAVETRESGSVGHAQRVAELTLEAARKLGVSGKELQRIEYAALLMDIGNANVPQRLLVKKEPLAPEEWEILKSHVTLGAEMVKAVPFLADIADYVKHHHEYWDGTGYPDGLRGEEIPLACRILGLCADYDAMTSERPYHSRVMTSEEAMSEIRRGVGAKYDPTVAAVFLDMIYDSLRKENAEVVDGYTAA